MIWRARYGHRDWSRLIPAIVIGQARVALPPIRAYLEPSDRYGARRLALCTIHTIGVADYVSDGAMPGTSRLAPALPDQLQGGDGPIATGEKQRLRLDHGVVKAVGKTRRAGARGSR